MQISRNKTIATAITALLMLTLTLSVALPLAFAHDPPWSIPTYAYIQVSPSPVGVGQDTFVIMWVDKVPPTAGGIGGDRWTGMTVTITKPDGTTENKGPYTSDATSSAYFSYTPNQVGTYTFVFNFPNQLATGINPTNGVPYDPAVAMYGAAYINDTYLASTATTTLIVQDEPVQEPPSYPLPTEYWTRPIEGQNTAWSTIASNWLGSAAIVDRVQPSGVAPTSPHIMWTKPLQDGGIVGGLPEHNGTAYYQGLSYEGRWGTPIIIGGRLYYDTPLSDDPNDGPYTCVDLRTGETLWQNKDISPTFGQLYYYESFNQHGVIGDGYLWQVSGTTWRAYDPRTGEWLFNMTGVPSGYGGGFLGGYGSGAVGPNGEILIYVLNNANHWLALWNSSAGRTSPLVLTPGVGTNAYQYRPIGKNANMSQEYTWNVTIPALPPGSSILRAIPGDLILGYTGFSSFIGFGTPDPYYFWAISLKEGSIGTLLWQKSYSAPAGNMTRAFGSIDTLARVFTLTNKETMQWLGYDLDTGEYLWGPLGDFRDFQYYGIVSHPPAPSYSAYGLTYVGGYGGEIHAFESTTGTLVWKYNNTYSAHETPWGYYPLYIAAIADGKIYAYTSEHSPNLPQYKGSKVRCINATTGEEIWTLTGWYAVGSFGEETMPVADGYIAYLNTYDMQIYCIGKGPSATTITAPDVGIAFGSSVVIRGTVTDISAGTKQTQQTARFPNGVPAVSDESMSAWMEYVYMQKPCPADITGVEVAIDVLDANGNYRNIGTTTSDAYGAFSFMWTPDIPGKYTVVATYAGSESYYGSYASTAFGVDEAPEATPEPTQPPASIADQYFLPVSGGIIAAIAIVGVILALLLRKR